MATGRRATMVLFPLFLTMNPTMMPSCTLAMHEGRLRNAVVRQVDRRLNSLGSPLSRCSRRNCRSRNGMPVRDFSHQHAGVQLAVVGHADADKINTLAVPEVAASST